MRETPQNTKGANTMNTIKTLRSKVMTIANRFVKNGLPRRMAMIKAWGIAKNPDIDTLVRNLHIAKGEPIGNYVKLDRKLTKEIYEEAR